MSEQPGRGQSRPEPTPPASTGPAGAGAPDARPPGGRPVGDTSKDSKPAPRSGSGEPAAETTRPAHGFDSRGKVRTTRAGAWWTALVFAAILSILILVFIVQNGESVVIKFLGFEGELPLAVSLLAAAVAGALVVAVPGIFRIIQLRRALTRNAKES